MLQKKKIYIFKKIIYIFDFTMAAPSAQCVVTAGPASLWSGGSVAMLRALVILDLLNQCVEWHECWSRPVGRPIVLICGVTRKMQYCKHVDFYNWD
jgi:hypothetical protein